MAKIDAAAIEIFFRSAAGNFRDCARFADERGVSASASRQPNL